MLIKTNICSVWNYLRGNTDHQQFENNKQNVDVPPGRISADDHEWLCFLASVFSCFHSLRIVCFFLSS